MTDKPKRKNDQPIPRRYWWIFGILAIVLLYPFPIWWLLPQWVLTPFPDVLTISAFLLLICWYVWRYRIEDKQKAEDIPSTPRRYWWIFGTLMLMLLIGLRFPVKILYWWGLNLFLYRLVMLGCLVAIFQFLRRYHWKRMIVALMLVCIVLAGWQTYVAMYWLFVRDSRAECNAEHHYVVTITKCRVGGSWGGDFISFRYIPIGIEFDRWSSV